MGYENIAQGKLKNTNTTVNMAYTNGDRLLFKGTSGNYSNAITDMPTSSKTITFNFTACSDFDNNNYATVQIGTQIWMAENLKTTHYKNGTAIPNVTDNAAWAALSTGAYCDYNNTPANITTYGRLYNWYAVNTGNMPCRLACTKRCRMDNITTYLGGESVAGGKLKATTLWNNPNTGLLTKPALQPFRVATVSALVHTTSLATAEAGGVLPSTIYDLLWYKFVYYGGSDAGRNDVSKRSSFVLSVA